MSSDSISAKVIQLVPLLLLLACPFALTYDFSRSNLWFYDFLSMNSNVLWFLLVFTVVVALVSWRNPSATLPSLIAVVLLFSIAEIAVNYPMIWRDVYLHGSVCAEILEKGHITDTWNPYAEGYPGFFLLWSIAAAVTGIDLFPSNLFLLLPVAAVLLILIIVAFYRRMSLDRTDANIAALLAFLVINFNTNEFTLVHFNTRLLSLISTLVFFLLLVACKQSTARNVALLLTYISLVISHPLNSLAIVVFLGGSVIFRLKQPKNGTSLFLSCVIIYIAWAAYLSYLPIEAVVRSLLDFFGGVKFAMETAYGWSPTLARPEPLFGILLGVYYKVLLVALGIASVYSAIALRARRHANLLALYLASILTLYGAAFLLGIGDIAINRGILFVSVALAGLPIMLLASRRAHHPNHQLRRKVLFTLIIVLIVPQFVYTHQLPLARYERVGSIDDTFVFISDHRGGQPIASLGDLPIYYTYYEPMFRDYYNLYFSEWASLKDISLFLADNPGVKVVDYRNVIDWGATLGRSRSYSQAVNEWNEGVSTKLDAEYDRVYCTGFEIIYV